MTEQSPVPTEIVGRRPPMTPRVSRVTVVLAVLFVLFVVVQVARGRWTGLVVFGFWAVVLVGRQARPRTVVDASGIRRPWHRRSHIPWADVETIAEPLPGNYPVRLNLAGGSTVSLRDIPAAESAAVAEFGGKRVARTVPVRPPPPGPGRRTDADVEADVARRARVLAEERAAWERQNPRPRATREGENP